MPPTLVVGMGIEFLHPVERNKVTKFLRSIAADDLPALYATLREADTRLQTALYRVLSLNHYPGYQTALRYLGEVTDPANACRAAAVCLLANKMEAPCTRQSKF